jgi:hypothetical protein
MLEIFGVHHHSAKVTAAEARALAHHEHALAIRNGVMAISITLPTSTISARLTLRINGGLNGFDNRKPFFAQLHPLLT